MLRPVDCTVDSIVRILCHGEGGDKSRDQVLRIQVLDTPSQCRLASTLDLTIASAEDSGT